MTSSTAFTTQEWNDILQGPASAGIMVIAAQRGGTLRESFSIAKAYASARRQHGQSELLDAVVAARPEVDRERYGSAEELAERSLTHVTRAVAVLDGRVTPEELDEYRRFVVKLTRQVAAAHGEGAPGEEAISAAEASAVEAIADALGASPS
jgi:hypothetical protein